MKLELYLSTKPLIHGAAPTHARLGTIETDQLPVLGMVINHGQDVLTVVAVGSMLKAVAGDLGASKAAGLELVTVCCVTKVGRRPAPTGPLVMLAVDDKGVPTLSPMGPVL